MFVEKIHKNWESRKCWTQRTLFYTWIFELVALLNNWKHSFAFPNSWCLPHNFFILLFVFLPYYLHFWHPSNLSLQSLLKPSSPSAFSSSWSLSFYWKLRASIGYSDALIWHSCVQTWQLYWPIPPSMPGITGDCSF